MLSTPGRQASGAIGANQKHERIMGMIIWVASYLKSDSTSMWAFLANYVLARRGPLPVSELGAFTLSDTRPRFYLEAAGRPIGETMMRHRSDCAPEHKSGSRRPGCMTTL
jgi:hypothetical protein